MKCVLYRGIFVERIAVGVHGSPNACDVNCRPSASRYRTAEHFPLAVVRIIMCPLFSSAFHCFQTIFFNGEQARWDAYKWHNKTLTAIADFRSVCFQVLLDAFEGLKLGCCRVCSWGMLCVLDGLREGIEVKPVYESQVRELHWVRKAARHYLVRFW